MRQMCANTDIGYRCDSLSVSTHPTQEMIPIFCFIYFICFVTIQTIWMQIYLFAYSGPTLTSNKA